MTIKDKLLIYINRKYCELEASKSQLNHNRRYYPMDSLDYYESMRTDIEIQCFKSFVDDITAIVLNCK